MITRQQARDLTSKILSFATLPELEVSVVSGHRAHLRFARNAASTSGASDVTNLSITAWKGKRRASVTAAVNVAAGAIDESALRKMVAEAEMLAAFSPEDPEYLPPLGAQTYLEPKAYDTATAEMPAAARAQVVGEAIAAAKNSQLIAAGIYRNSGVVQVLANSAGLFGYFPWSRAAFSITTRTSDGTGSGYAALSSNNAQSIDCKEAAAIAVKKALDSRGARELPPGAYPAILEPQAVADISSSLIFALNARLADEGRSVFSAPGGKTRVGEKMFDPRVHIQTDPQHSVVPGSSFSAGGAPTR